MHIKRLIQLQKKPAFGSIDEVEPAEIFINVLQQAAMSFGSISWERILHWLSR
jgi:glutamate synthase domain-containing protein 2